MCRCAHGFSLPRRLTYLQTKSLLASRGRETPSGVGQFLYQQSCRRFVRVLQLFRTGQRTSDTHWQEECTTICHCCQEQCCLRQQLSSARLMMLSLVVVGGKWRCLIVCFACQGNVRALLELTNSILC